GTVTFTCTTPSYTMQQPFAGTPPNAGDTVYVMAPDPFDSRGVYPLYNPGSSSPPTPDTSRPTFAVYPLIYSSGADKAYGVVADGFPSLVDYATNGINPFFFPTSGQMIGTQAHVQDDGSNMTAWLDNIHNHQVTTK